MRNTRKEQMFSAVPPAADIRHGISKTYRFNFRGRS